MLTTCFFTVWIRDWEGCMLYTCCNDKPQLEYIQMINVSESNCLQHFVELFPEYIKVNSFSYNDYSHRIALHKISPLGPHLKISWCGMLRDYLHICGICIGYNIVCSGLCECNEHDPLQTCCNLLISWQTGCVPAKLTPPPCPRTLARGIDVSAC